MKKIIKKILQAWQYVTTRPKEKSKFFYTFDQVSADIASGKCKMIFYSCTTLWWSHDREDLKESDAIGLMFCKERHIAEMKSNRHNQDAKARLRGLYNNFINAKDRAPLDFVGQALFQTPDLFTWMNNAQKHPEQFGRNGLDAFMKMHHKNCDNKTFMNWDDVNFEIDGIPIRNAEILQPKVVNPEITGTARNRPCPCGSGKKYKHCCHKNDLN